MIEELLRKFGFYPTSELDRAYREGRDQGEDDMQREYRHILKNVRAQYSGIERERNHLIQLIADHKALQPPAPIIIRNGALVEKGQ